MLLVLNCGIEKSWEDTKDFLNQLNIYNEVKQIDTRVWINSTKYDINKLKKLCRSDSNDTL